MLGDFYVEQGCCTLCGVPWHVAPDLFADAPDGCYVQKQPALPAELARMRDVMRLQELACVRYRGRDEAILKSLADVGAGDKCDVTR